jgi:ATP-dependent DNA helicase PIF1
VTLTFLGFSRTTYGRAILSVINEDSLDLNNKVLNLINRTEVVFKSVDTIVSEDTTDQLAFPEEFLNSLTPAGMPPHELKLKVGAVMMLLRNLMPMRGLCNGTTLTVTRIQTHIIKAKVIGAANSDMVLVPRILLIPSDTNLPFSFKRK